MKKMQMLLKTVCLTLLLCATSVACYGVNVTLLHDSNLSTSELNAIAAAERNLATVLTEVNVAQMTESALETQKFKMDDFAVKSIARIWAVTPFYCDDYEVVERVWVFQDGTMMVRNIPLIITPEDHGFGYGDYQAAVVEFDRTGRITDFRLSISAQMAEDMEHCGSTVEQEKRAIILKYVEQFRTAYNQKDADLIEKMFSDDALIITGKVVTVRNVEQGSFSQKVQYNKQSKQQYIANLRKAFARNKWIQVEFTNIGYDDIDDIGGCGGITRSKIDPTKYGVRLRQEWKSENYNDEGYLFLLWEFPEDGRSPVIHVRTWQPEVVNGVVQKPDNNISTLEGFDL
jgi:hypothetical protein